MSYSQSDKYKRKELYGKTEVNKKPNLESFLPTILSLPKDPEAVLNGIDKYCMENWMMNLGDDKGKVVKGALQEFKPKSILELGTYYGYSSLLFAFLSKAKVHTFDPNEQTTAIAQKVHQHAGLQDLIACHVGTIQTEETFIKEHGPFDMIFIDHWKDLYLSDLKWLQEKGVIQKGTVLVADNILKPGVPDYHQYFKESKDYTSILYHSNTPCSDEPDAVLVSQRIQ